MAQRPARLAFVVEQPRMVLQRETCMSQNDGARFGTPSPSGDKLITGARQEQAKRPGQPLVYPYSSEPDDHPSQPGPEKNGHYHRILDLKPGITLSDGQTLNGESLDTPRRARKDKIG